MTPSRSIHFPPVLDEIEVVGDRGVRIIVVERMGLGAPRDDRFELFWEVAVGVLVRGDPFPLSGPSGVTIHDLGEDTPFLDMIRSDSETGPEYVDALLCVPSLRPSAVRHWRVSTTEALIDVAAPHEPQVRLLSDQPEI